MIEWLSEWLMEIIIIVLLAVFVDLLLPSSNMQKYAKMILGLLIILTIISPILGIFGDEYAIADMIEQQYQSISKDSQKLELKMNPEKQYEEQMLEQVEETMKQQLNGHVENNLNISITDIELKATLSQESWTIEQLNIFVRKGSTEENNKEGVEPIESVQEVNIDLDSQKSAEEKEENKIDTENTQLISEITKLVKTEWGIAEEIIFVTIQ